DVGRQLTRPLAATGGCVDCSASRHACRHVTTCDFERRNAPENVVSAAQAPGGDTHECSVRGLTPRFRFIAPLPRCTCAPPALHCSAAALHCAPPALHCSAVALHCAPLALHCSAVALHCAPPALHCSAAALHCAPPALHCSAAALHVRTARAALQRRRAALLHRRPAVQRRRAALPHPRSARAPLR